MNKDNSIHNLTEFIQKVSELNESTTNFRSTSVSSLNFYRGQANSSWELEPKLYRENLFSKEGVLISEFMRVSPNDFKGNYFNRLVKMQHYGLPTRLLDTTQNP
ncbi:MAG TPA: FRG domain-containing protein, partial [Bacteroidales bacterium]|nr:FRG domain-containing protein [Bacteroidales bacterium]